jgi:hypothetical protein
MSSLGNDLAKVIVAAVLVGLGGDGFLRGVLGVAYWLRVPKLLVCDDLGGFCRLKRKQPISPATIHWQLWISASDGFRMDFMTSACFDHWGRDDL